MLCSRESLPATALAYPFPQDLHIDDFSQHPSRLGVPLLSVLRASFEAWLSHILVGWSIG